MYIKFPFQMVMVFEWKSRQLHFIFHSKQVSERFFQVGAILANAVDDGQWSQGLISAVSNFNFFFLLKVSEKQES